MVIIFDIDLMTMTVMIPGILVNTPYAWSKSFVLTSRHTVVQPGVQRLQRQELHIVFHLGVQNKSHTLSPIIMVQWKMGVSPIGSLPFMHSSPWIPLNPWIHGRKAG